MRVLAVYSIKGGVGKTATAVHLAYLSARDGARTLLWDLDPQGAASFYLKVRPEIRGGVKRLFGARREAERHIRYTEFERLDLLPADLSYRHLDLTLARSKRPEKRLRRLLKPLRDTYDHVLLDCAPSISLVSESIFAAADVLLVPTVPTTLSLRTLDQLRERVAAMKRRAPRILPFFSMVDLRKSLHRGICDRDNGYAATFLKTRIPYASVVEQMGLRREPIELYARGSTAAGLYRDLWNEIAAATN